MPERFWTKDIIYMSPLLKNSGNRIEDEIIPIRPESVKIAHLASLGNYGIGWQLTVSTGDPVIFKSPFPVPYKDLGKIERLFPKDRYICVINRIHGFLSGELFAAPEIIESIRDRKIKFTIPFPEFGVYSGRAAKTAEFDILSKAKAGGRMSIKNTD